MQEQFENNEISRLLGGLNKVEAPGDFEFRVNARIATGRPEVRAPFGWLVKAAVPLVLVLVIGAYFGYRTLRTQPVADQPQVAEAPKSMPAPPLVEAPTAAPQPVENPSVATNEPKRDNVVPQPDGSKPAAPKADNQPGGGSFEEAKTEARSVYPKGVDPRRTQADANKALTPGAHLPLSSFLTIAGMNGAMGQGGWRVSSVVDRSMAARAGVKADDVIEAVNDQQITANMDLPSNFTIKSLRVKRGADSITIPLKN